VRRIGYLDSSMTKRTALLAAALLAAPVACDRRGGGESSAGAPSPSASVVSLAVEMGACPDLGACERECDAGSADRCRRLGVTYEFGRKGVDADPVRATELYVHACQMKDTEACISAGRMYEYHHGVDKDDVKATGFYERACDLANPTGCANLAIMLENGRGTARDEGRALQLFDDACAKGAGLACEHARSIRARRG
jgi:TPR repeat protein